MEEERRGKTTIAPDVLTTIARLSALSVSGVARTAPAPRGVNRLMKRSGADGVRVEVGDNLVTVDLHLVVQADRDIREIGQAVQAAVREAIQQMVGMDVTAVNVTVDDVEYSEDAETEQP